MEGGGGGSEVEDEDGLRLRKVPHGCSQRNGVRVLNLQLIVWGWG